MHFPNGNRGLFVLACFLLFSGNRLLSADPTEWPPALKGAKDGTVTLKTDRFLDVPEAVATAAKKEGAAPFTVAKTAPTVDFAYHRDLGPNAISRRLWSSWGDICLAGDGRVYVAIGDHGDDVGGDAPLLPLPLGSDTQDAGADRRHERRRPAAEGPAGVVEGARQDRRGARRQDLLQLHAQRRQPRRSARELQLDRAPARRPALPASTRRRARRRCSPTCPRSAARRRRCSTASATSGGATSKRARATPCGA